MKQVNELVKLQKFFDITVDVESCGGYVFFSCLGYASLVLALVWLGVGIIRLTPTHSRGAVLGMTFSLATLGNALPTLDVSGTFVSNTIFPSYIQIHVHFFSLLNEVSCHIIYI